MKWLLQYYSVFCLKIGQRLTMTSSILLANLLFLSSCGGDVTAAADIRNHYQSKGLRPLRRQLQTNDKDNEFYLPGGVLFGAGDSTEWGSAAVAVTTATNDDNNSTTEMNHHRPTLINITALDQAEYVTDTSAGTLHSTVVTNQGRILTAGSVAIQSSGIGRDTLDGTQLDFQPIREVYYLDDKKEDATHDKNPSTPPTFSKVFASQYYTLALDTSGNVWSTGTNTYGQLCLGDTTARDRFYQVARIAEEASTMSKVVDIALGERHTLLLMDNGQVFGCGWNAYGQLGIGLKGENMLAPVEILIDEPDVDNSTELVANVTQIAAGRGSSYFLTTSDHVYATGTNYEGQLCLGDRVDRPLPTMLVPVEDMQNEGKNDFSLNDEGVNVHLIAAGKSSLYMLFSNGQVVACGKNTHGQLGTDNNSNETASDVPAVVTALANVTDIFASAISFTAFFLQSNGIYGVGQDGSGQLGNGAMQWNPLSEVSCPGDEETRREVVISSGNDHTLFLVNTNGIFDCEVNSKNPTDASSMLPTSSMAPTSSMSPTSSTVAPTPTAPPQGSSSYVPTSPSPQPPTKSPVKADRNQPSGSVKVNGMGVICLGIALAAWQLT